MHNYLNINCIRCSAPVPPSRLDAIAACLSCRPARALRRQPAHGPPQKKGRPIEATPSLCKPQRIYFVAFSAFASFRRLRSYMIGVPMKIEA